MTSISPATFLGRRPASAVALVLAMVLGLCLCLAAPGAAWANKVVSAPTNVSDDITRVHVVKLDADTHEYVKGATMQIIQKDTGKVVDEWVTDGTVHEIEKELDVNVTYILRELSAPSRYDAVSDIEFVVNELEGSGISVLSAASDEWELSESYKLSVYDAATPVEKEEVVHKTRSTSGSDTPSSSSSSESVGKGGVKTGDTTPVLPIVGVAIVAVIALAVAIRRRKDSNGDHARK